MSTSHIAPSLRAPPTAGNIFLFTACERVGSVPWDETNHMCGTDCCVAVISASAAATHTERQSIAGTSSVHQTKGRGHGKDFGTSITML